MKRVFLGLVVGLVFAGCSPSKDIESETKTNPPVQTPKATATGTTASTPLPATGTSTSTSATGTTSGAPATGSTASTTPTGTTSGTTPGSTPAPTPAPAPPVDKSQDIPDRAFQLRSLQHTTVKVNGHSLDSWVMDSESKRAEGMMFLKDKDVKDDQGMIFIFRDPQTTKNGAGFYMKNTILPLDIIYVATDHKVLNIAEGKPFDEKSLPSSGAYTSVLELKQGQAAKLGIKPGTVIDFPKDLKSEN